MTNKETIETLELCKRLMPKPETMELELTTRKAIAAIDSAINKLNKPKGEWIKVTGYATPGGDPVWECSRCGKGRHVYGIEAPSYQGDVSNHQWIACPNCGAIMKNENF